MTEPSPLGWTYLKEYLKAQDQEDAFVERAWDEAVLRVVVHIGATYNSETNTYDPVDSGIPFEIFVRAVTETGAALYQRRQDTNGIRGYNGIDGTPIFAAKDPMNSVYPLLRQWVLPF